MITNRKRAALAFLGGAGLGLLGGCAAQSPGTYYQPVPLSSAAATRAYLEQQERVWNAQHGLMPRQFPVQFDDPPVTQAAPRPRRFTPAADGPVISENPPAPIRPPAPKAPADPDCVGWWQICHFL